ncbi:hypothetical protein [Atopomonas sediminilitoris]|uniref:hypothetical protein n=1 Tax=Atopomonas sediminilitoris TaxID=2919919 RepID=UPI001F4EB370|nr:hypothetical protein [Atopomonas sediminilitoris]MCJ8167871.1 hypothetical protein [Atopomonas sediminilitoris]
MGMLNVCSKEYVSKGHYRVDLHDERYGYLPRVDFMTVGAFKRRFGLPDQDVANNVAEADVLASKASVWHVAQSETQGLDRVRVFLLDDLRSHFKLRDVAEFA